jgi:hypothetical protein
MKLTKFQSQGAIGIVTFWLTLLLIGISASSGIFCIYWLSLAASSIWLSAIGPSLAIATAFLMVLSFGSLALLFLILFEVKILFPTLTEQMFAVSTFLCELLCCILMSLSTDSHAADYYGELMDYCARNVEDATVVAFRTEHPTDFSIHSYVYVRTTDRSGSIAAFFGLWLPAVLAFLVCERKAERASPPGQPQNPPEDRKPAERERSSSGPGAPSPAKTEGADRSDHQ